MRQSVKKEETDLAELHRLLGRNVRRLTDAAWSRVRTASERYLQEGRGTVFVVVPDQYTMTAERELLRTLDNSVLLPVQVVSFKRLASLVTGQTGGGAGRVLSGSGKHALMRYAYAEVEPDLNVFRGCGSPHFIDALCREISGLKTYRVSSEMLCRAGDDRLSDLATIQEAYERALACGFSDPDDRLRILAEDAQKSGLFAGATVMVCFFKVLRAAEIRVIGAMLAAGADVTVTLMTPELTDRGDLLSPVVSVCSRLGEEAERVGASVETVHLAEPYSMQKDFAEAERSLFRRDPKKKLPEDGGGYTFYCGSSRADEVDFAACEITRLVREEGYRYGDFAIVTRRPEVYEPYLDAVFSEYAIPVFFHRKTSLRSKLPIRLALAALEAVTVRTVTDAFGNLADGGLFSLTAKDRADFLRYVQTWNLRFLSDFDRPFLNSISGFKNRSEESEEERAAGKNAERVRQILLAAVQPFRGGKKTVRTFCENVYHLCEDADVPELLKRRGKEYRNWGEYALAADDRGVLKLLYDTLDELCAVAGDREIGARDFSVLLQTAADGADIGRMPTSLDEVLSGAADVIPLLNQRVIFVLGLADGEFPAIPAEEGLIGDLQKQKLASVGVRVAPDRTERYRYEMFFTAFALTSAAEHTVLSCVGSPGSEKGKSPAYRALLAQTGATEQTAVVCDSRIQKEKPSFALYTRKPLRELDEYFRSQPSYAPYFRQDEPDDRLQPQTAERLFGSQMRVSASKVKSFYQCRYRYFYKFGIRPLDVNRAGFDARNSGTFIHAMLERVMKDDTWLEADAPTLRTMVKTAAEAYFSDIFGCWTPPASFRSYQSTLEKCVVRLLCTFRDELKRSGFRPLRFEQKITEDGDLKSVKIPAGRGTVQLTGTVDRIDVLERDGMTYLRVVDYKSGTQTFSLALACDGTDIQLLMYLYAIHAEGLGNLTNIRPTAAIYEDAKNRVTDELKEESNSKKSGSEKGGSKMGVYVETDGIFVPDNVDRLSGRELDTVFAFVRMILARMGETLLDGDFAREPLKDDSVCKWCDLKDICPRNARRERQRVCSKEKEALDYMKKQTEQEVDSHEN